MPTLIFVLDRDEAGTGRLNRALRPCGFWPGCSAPERQEIAAAHTVDRRASVRGRRTQFLESFVRAVANATVADTPFFWQDPAVAVFFSSVPS